MARTYSSPLLNQICQVIRIKHLSPSTEKSYVTWIKRYIIYHGKRHPKDMGSQELEQFLTHLAVKKHVAASTQNQAFCAVLFLYREVLKIELDGRIKAFRAKRPKRKPVILTADEVIRIAEAMEDEEYKLMIELAYGCGFRLNELTGLRIKEIDFENREITICDGKGMKDRVTMLPDELVRTLKRHLKKVKPLHDQDIANGYGYTVLPDALSRKYPGAPREWKWQFVFPASTLCNDPKTGRLVRFHRHGSTLQKALRKAVRKAGITKRVTCHTFRHSFATHLLEGGTSSKKVQQIMGHKSLKTTEQYLHALNDGRVGVRSPLDEWKERKRREEQNDDEDE
jgi:integron integrase